jgi:hypothetical protein
VSITLKRGGIFSFLGHDVYTIASHFNILRAVSVLVAIRRNYVTNCASVLSLETAYRNSDMTTGYVTHID